MAGTTGVAQAASRPKAVASPRPRPGPARFFYSGAAALLLVLMFLGFQQFYLHGRAFPNRPLAPPIRNLIIAHGLAMTAWVALLVVQPLLIAKRKHRVHMLLGKIGAGLAACIFVLGLWVGVAAPKVAPPEVRLWNLPYKHFMAVPLISITIFAALVAAGIWYRRRPEVHRPMMLLATLAVVPAALDRIDALASLYRNTFLAPIFGPFLMSLVLGAMFLVVRWALTRKFDRYFAIGWVGLVLASAGIMNLATTQAWDRFATFLLQ
jgi:hypothetical protein